MKPESIETLKQLMVSTYRKFGSDRAILLHGQRSYTGDEIANEIENETEFGVKTINGIIQLSIDLIKRDKRNINLYDNKDKYIYDLAKEYADGELPHWKHVDDEDTPDDVINEWNGFYYGFIKGFNKAIEK